MSEQGSSGPETVDISSFGDWAERFRRVQERGAEYAQASYISLEDIPEMIREGRRTRTPEELTEAQRIVDKALGRKDNLRDSSSD